ncbi:MAG: WecB/TagA/CpsF family glycosyltransferase [Candidatus Binataceae bacterium]|jgi:N-acetylglucosaminyldiphosphoundecaprenol N-acetyl-beta-D-mannosaminyltransferase
MKLAPSANRVFSTNARIPVVDIMGCNISSVTVFEALATIETWIEQQSQRCKFVVATGFHGVWEAQKSSEFRNVLNSADLFCPDGIAPVWLSRIMGEPLNGRVPGPDLLAAFVSVANIKGYSSFFLGDTPETLAALATKIKDSYPGHRIAGTLSPPFRPLTAADNVAILEAIHRAKPDVLWVAFGLPKQELWISEHLKRLDIPVAVAVGAAFSFLSGKVRRAPPWMGSAGFEWLWRLAHEPRRLWHRDLIEGSRFLAHAIRVCARSRRQERDRRPYIE